MLSTDVETLRLFVESTLDTSSSSSPSLLRHHHEESKMKNESHDQEEETTSVHSSSSLEKLETTARMMFGTGDNNINHTMNSMNDNDDNDDNEAPPSSVVSSPGNSNSKSDTNNNHSNTHHLQQQHHQLNFDLSTPHGELNIAPTTALKTNVGWVTIHTTRGFRSGIHHWSVHIENQGETNDVSGLMVGILPKNTFSRFEGFISQGGGWCLSRGGKFYGQWKRIDVFSGNNNLNPQQQQQNTNAANQQHGIVFGTGDVVHLLLDVELGRLAVRVGDREVIGEFTQTVPPGTILVPALSLHYRQQHVRLGNHKSYSKKMLFSPWKEKLLNSTPACAFDLPYYVARELPFVHSLVHMDSCDVTTTSTTTSFPGEREAALRIAIFKRACEAAQNLQAMSSSSSPTTSNFTTIDNNDASSSLIQQQQQQQQQQPAINALWRGQIARRIKQVQHQSQSQSSFATSAGAIMISNTLTLLCKTLQQQQKSTTPHHIASAQLSQLCSSVCSALSSSSSSSSSFLRADSMMLQQQYYGQSMEDSAAVSSSSSSSSSSPQQQQLFTSSTSTQLIDEVMILLRQYLETFFASSGGLEEKKVDSKNQRDGAIDKTNDNLSPSLTTAAATTTPRSQTASFLKKLNSSSSSHQQHQQEQKQQQNNNENSNNNKELSSSARVVPTTTSSSTIVPPSASSVNFSVTHTSSGINNSNNNTSLTPKVNRSSSSLTTPSTSIINQQSQQQQQQHSSISTSSYFEFSSSMTSIFELLLTLALHRGRVGDVLSLVRFLLNSSHNVDDVPLKLKNNSKNNKSGGMLKSVHLQEYSNNNNNNISSMYTQIDSLLQKNASRASRFSRNQSHFDRRILFHFPDFLKRLFSNQQRISPSAVASSSSSLLSSFVLSGNHFSRSSSSPPSKMKIISFTLSPCDNFLFIHHSEGISKIDISRAVHQFSNNNVNQNNSSSGGGATTTSTTTTRNTATSSSSTSSTNDFPVVAFTNEPADLVGSNNISKWSSCAVSTSSSSSLLNTKSSKKRMNDNDDDDGDGDDNGENQKTTASTKSSSKRYFVLYTDQCVAREVAFIVYDFDTLEVVKVLDCSTFSRQSSSSSMGRKAQKWNPFVKLISTPSSSTSSSSSSSNNQILCVWFNDNNNNNNTSSSLGDDSNNHHSASTGNNNAAALLRSYIDNKSVFNPVNFANDASLFSSLSTSATSGHMMKNHQNEDAGNSTSTHQNDEGVDFDTGNINEAGGDNNNENEDSSSTSSSSSAYYTSFAAAALSLLSETTTSKKELVLGNVTLSCVDISKCLLAETEEKEKEQDDLLESSTSIELTSTTTLSSHQSINNNKISVLSLPNPETIVQFPLLQKCIQLSTALLASTVTMSSSPVDRNKQQQQQHTKTSPSTFGTSQLASIFTRPSQCTIELWISVTKSGLLCLSSSMNNNASDDHENLTSSSALIYQCGDRSNASVGEVFIELAVPAATAAAADLESSSPENTGLSPSVPCIRAGYRYDTSTSTTKTVNGKMETVTVKNTRGTVLCAPLPDELISSTTSSSCYFDIDEVAGGENEEDDENNNIRLNSSSWFHIALVCDGAAASSPQAWALYINGNIVSTSHMTTSQELSKAPVGHLFPYFSAAGVLVNNNGHNNNNNSGNSSSSLSKSAIVSSLKSSTWSLGSAGGHGSCIAELRVWLKARSRSEIIRDMRTTLMDLLRSSIASSVPSKAEAHQSTSSSSTAKLQQQISALSSLQYDSLMLYCPLTFSDDNDDGANSRNQQLVVDYSLYFRNFYLMNVLRKLRSTTTNNNNNNNNILTLMMMMNNDSIHSFKGWITRIPGGREQSGCFLSPRMNISSLPFVMMMNACSTSSSSVPLASSPSCWSLEKFLSTSFTISGKNQELVAVTPTVTDDTTKKTSSVTSATSNTGTLTGTGANSGDLGHCSIVETFRLLVSSSCSTGDTDTQQQPAAARSVLLSSSSTITLPHSNVLFSVAAAATTMIPCIEKNNQQIYLEHTIGIVPKMEGHGKWKCVIGTTKTENNNNHLDLMDLLLLPSSKSNDTRETTTNSSPSIVTRTPNGGVELVVPRDNVHDIDKDKDNSLNDPTEVTTLSLELLSILSSSSSNSTRGNNQNRTHLLPLAFIPLNFDLRREALEEIVSLIREHFKNSTNINTTSSSPLSSSRGVNTNTINTARTPLSGGDGGCFWWRSESLSPKIVKEALQILFNHLEKIVALDIDPRELNLVVSSGEVAAKLFGASSSRGEVTTTPQKQLQQQDSGNNNNNKNRNSIRRTPTPPTTTNTNTNTTPLPFPSPQRQINNTSSPSPSSSISRQNTAAVPTVTKKTQQQQNSSLGSRIFDILSDMLHFCSSSSSSLNNNNDLRSLAEQTLKIAITLLFPSQSDRQQLLLSALETTTSSSTSSKNENDKITTTTASSADPTQRVLLHRMLQHFGDVSQLSSSSSSEIHNDDDDDQTLLITRLVNYFSSNMAQLVSSVDRNRNNDYELFTTITQTIRAISCLQFSFIVMNSGDQKKSGTKSKSTRRKDLFGSAASRTSLERGILNPSSLILLNDDENEHDEDENNNKGGYYYNYLSQLQHTLEQLLLLVNCNHTSENANQHLQLTTLFINSVIFPVISSFSANNSIVDLGKHLGESLQYFVDLPSKMEEKKVPFSSSSRFLYNKNLLLSSIKKCSDEALRAFAIVATRKMLSRKGTSRNKQQTNNNKNNDNDSAVPLFSCPGELRLRIIPNDNKSSTTNHSSNDQQHKIFLKAVEGDASIWGSSQQQQQQQQNTTGSSPAMDLGYKALISAACYLYYHSSSSSSTMTGNKGPSSSSSSTAALRETILRNATSLTTEVKANFVTRCGVVMSKMENTTAAMKRLANEMKILVEDFELDRGGSDEDGEDEDDNNSGSNTSRKDLSISRICSLILEAMNRSNNVSASSTAFMMASSSSNTSLSKSKQEQQQDLFMKQQQAIKKYVGMPFSAWLIASSRLDDEIEKQAKGLSELAEIATTSSSSPRLVCLTLWCRSVPLLEENLRLITGGNSTTNNNTNIPNATKRVRNMKSEAEQKLLDTALLLCHGASSGINNSNSTIKNKHLLCEILHHTISYSSLSKLIKSNIAERVVELLSLKEYFVQQQQQSSSSSPTSAAASATPSTIIEDSFQESASTSTRAKARRQSKRDRRIKRQREISIFPESYDSTLFVRDSLKEETLAHAWVMLRELATKRCTDVLSSSYLQQNDKNMQQQHQGIALLNSILCAIEKELEFALEMKSLDFIDAVAEQLEGLLSLMCTMLQSLPFCASAPTTTSSSSTTKTSSSHQHPPLVRIICKLTHRLLYKSSPLASAVPAGSSLSIAEMVLHLIRHSFFRGSSSTPSISPDLESLDQCYYSMFPANHFEKLQQQQQSITSTATNTSPPVGSSASNLNSFLGINNNSNNSTSSSTSASSILNSAFRKNPSSILRTIFEVAIGSSQVSSHEPLCGSVAACARRLLTHLIRHAPPPKRSSSSSLADTLLTSIKSILEVTTCRLSTTSAEHGDENAASSSSMLSPKPDTVYLLWATLSSIFGPIADSPRVGDVMRKSNVSSSSLSALLPSSPLPGPAERSATLSGTHSDLVVVSDVTPVTASSVATVVRASAMAMNNAASPTTSSGVAGSAASLSSTGISNSITASASDMAQVVSLESLLLLSSSSSSSASNQKQQNNNDDIGVFSSEQQANKPPILLRSDALLACGPRLGQSSTSMKSSTSSTTSTNSKTQYRHFLDEALGGSVPSYVQTELTQTILDVACVLCRVPMSFNSSNSQNSSSSSTRSPASKIAICGWTCASSATAVRALAILLSFPQVVSTQLLLPVPAPTRKSVSTSTTTTSNKTSTTTTTWNDENNKIKLRYLFDTLCTKRVSDGSPLWVLEEQAAMMLTSLVFSPAFRTSLLIDNAAATTAVASVASMSTEAALMRVFDRQRNRADVLATLTSNSASTLSPSSPQQNQPISTSSTTTTQQQNQPNQQQQSSVSSTTTTTVDPNTRFNAEMLSTLSRTLPPDSTLFSRSGAVVSSAVSGCNVLYSSAASGQPSSSSSMIPPDRSSSLTWQQHQAIFGGSTNAPPGSHSSSSLPATHHLVFRHPSAGIKCSNILRDQQPQQQQQQVLSLLPSSSLTAEIVVCVPDATKLTLGSSTSASCNSSLVSSIITSSGSTRTPTAPTAITPPVFAASPFQLLMIRESKHQNILMSIAIEAEKRKLIIKRALNPYAPIPTSSKNDKKKKNETKRQEDEDDNDNDDVDDDDEDHVVTLVISLNHREIGRWMRLAVVYDTNVDALLAYGDGLLLGTASICGRAMQQRARHNNDRSNNTSNMMTAYHHRRHQQQQLHNHHSHYPPRFQNSPLHQLHMQYQQLQNQFGVPSSTSTRRTGNKKKKKQSHQNNDDDDDDVDDYYRYDDEDEEEEENEISENQQTNSHQEEEEEPISFAPVPISVSIGGSDSSSLSSSSNIIEPNFFVSLGGLRVWPHSISGHKLKFSADDPLAESPLFVFRFGEGTGNTTTSETLPPSIIEEEPPVCIVSALLGELSGAVFWMPTDSKQFAQETDTRTPEEIWSTAPGQLLALLQSNNNANNGSLQQQQANLSSLALPGGAGSMLAPESEVSSDGAGSCAVRREWLGKAMSSDATSLGLGLVNVTASLSGHYARSVFLSLMTSLSSPVFPVVLNACADELQQKSSTSCSSIVASILGQQQQQSSSASATGGAPIPLLELLAVLSPEYSPRKHQQQDSNAASPSPPLDLTTTASRALSALPSVAFHITRYIAHKRTDGVVAKADDPLHTPSSFIHRTPLQVLDDVTRKVTTTSLLLFSSGTSQQQQQQKKTAKGSSSPTTTTTLSESSINFILRTFVIDIVDACAPEFEARAIDVAASSSSASGVNSLMSASSLLLGGSSALAGLSGGSGADGSSGGWILPLITAGQANSTFVISLEGATNLEQLQIFQDRNLRNQIAKFPDSQGSWTEVEHLCGNWIFIKPGTSASSSSSASSSPTPKAIIKTRTQRCYSAARTLDSILSVGLSFSSSSSSSFVKPLIQNICNAPVLISLLSLCHVEAGTHRALFSRLIVGLLQLWAKHPTINPHDRMPLGFLFDRMGAATSILFRREDLNSACPGSTAPRFVQHVAEIILTAAQTEEAWFGSVTTAKTNQKNSNNNFISVSQNRWSEAMKHFYVSKMNTQCNELTTLDQIRKLFALSETSISRASHAELKKKIMNDIFVLKSRESTTTTTTTKEEDETNNTSIKLTASSNNNTSNTTSPRSPFARSDRFLPLAPVIGGGNSSINPSNQNNSSINTNNNTFLLNSNLVDLESIPTHNGKPSHAETLSTRKVRRDTLLCSAERGFGCFRSTTGYSSGQWYFEVKIPQSFSNIAIAVVLSTFKLPPGFAVGDPPVNTSSSSLNVTLPFGQSADGGQSWCFDGTKLCRLHNGIKSEFAFRAKWKARDVIGIMMDLDSGTLSCLHNGKSTGASFDNLKSCAASAAAALHQQQQNSSSSSPSSPPKIYFHPAVSFAQGGCEVNFGGAPFVCGPPGAITSSSPAAMATDILYGGSHTPSSATSSFLPFDPIGIKKGLHQTPPMMAGQLLISLVDEMTKSSSSSSSGNKNSSSTSASAAAASSGPITESSTLTEWLLKSSALAVSNFSKFKQQQQQQKKTSSVTKSSASSSSLCSPFAEGRSGDEEVPLVVLEGKARVESEFMSFSSPTFGCARALGLVTTIAGHVRIASRGRWYYELHVQGEGLVLVGWATQGFSPDATRSRSIGDDLHSWGIDGCRMLARHNRQQRSLGRHPWRDGDIIGSLIDCDAGVIHFSVNGIPLRDVSEPTPLSSDTNSNSNEKNPIFSRVPTSLGLFPVVTVEPETQVNFAFNRDELVYCPPDANPLGCGEVFCASVENKFSSSYSSYSPDTHSSTDDIDDSETKQLLAPTSSPQELLSTIKRISDKIGAHIDPDFSRPINWSRVCTDVANEASRSIMCVQTVALFLMRISRLAAFANKFCPYDVDCLEHATPNSCTGSLQHAIQFLYSHNLVLSSGSCSLALGSFFKRTNGLLDPNSPNPNSATNAAAILANQNIKLSLSRRRANMLPSGSKFVDSILGQVFSLLQDKSPSLFLTGKRLWTVSFIGEGADDAGGPYRESVGSICQEVNNNNNSTNQQQLGGGDNTDTDNNNGSSLSSPLLFIPSQNQEMNLGEVRDKFVLDPAGFRQSREVLLPLVYFFGQLIGGCLRSGDLLPLSLPSIVWKFLVGAHTSSSMTMNPMTNGTTNMMNYLSSSSSLFEEDMSQIDSGIVSTMQFMNDTLNNTNSSSSSQSEMSMMSISDVYDGPFAVVDSSGEEIPLFPGAEDIQVSNWSSVPLLLHLWKKFRLFDESFEALLTLVRGFHSVVPPMMLRGLRWSHLERAICGRSDFSVTDMENSARYEGLSKSDDRVVWFWRALRSWTPQDRSAFARFISGRERLATVPKLKLLPSVPPEDCANEDELLPHASTCFIWLSLPNYSSYEVLAQKLLYAVRHCVDIDADFRVREGEEEGDLEQQGPRLLRARPTDDGEFEDYSHLL